MSEVRISAEPRTEFGKGGARRTRRAGKIPAVLYGHGEKPKHVALSAHAFNAILRHGGMNQLLSVDISDGTRELALPKALQRDPLKDTVEHVDLLLVRRGEKVTVEVPIEVTGESEKGGLLVHDTNTVSVEADAAALPESLELSVEGLAVGDSLTAEALKLPSGSALVSELDTLLVSNTAQTVDVEEEESGEEEGGEAGESAESESE